MNDEKEVDVPEKEVNPTQDAVLAQFASSLERLATEVATRPAVGLETSDVLTRIATALEKLVAGNTVAVDDAQTAIRQNITNLASRMGRTRDTDNDPVTVLAAKGAALDDRHPILPTTILLGGEASIFGSGLAAVCGIKVAGEAAVIQRRTSGEVAFTVPDSTIPGTVVIEVLVDGKTLFTLSVVVAADCTGGTIFQPSRRAARKGVTS
ncbi:MAG: hypothetical protein QOJ85_373 [Solirubrobacteraceae bacterium]|jgi:hypothetical protein|nr:hypothetical protein [Solirubrobacteraceae bacterium]